MGLENMTTPALEQYYTVAEVAAALKVKDRTIREWIGNGKIKAVLFGRHYRISASAIEAMKQA
jgi:excisionase family DNA binding protein